MTDLITAGAVTITPSLILGYESTREPRTIVHAIMGLESPDTTLRPAGLRKGRMELGFTGATAEADSRAAETTLATPAVFSLVSSDRLTVQMSFVLPEGGSLTRALEDQTRAAWVVAFDWQEVAA